MYDPLVDTQPGPNASYPPSYWAAQGMPNWPARSALPATADVIIIGAGYTGLNAAYELASRYQQDVVVVEANELAWGCSGRNAGFVMPATGRRSYQQWLKLTDLPTTQAIHAEQQLGISRVRQLIAAANRDCQQQTGGYLKLTHAPAPVQALTKQFELLQRLGDSAQLLTDREEIASFIQSPIARAALHYPQSFAVNPMQLAAATAELAQAAGAKLVTNACVNDWQSTTDGHQLSTSAGTIRASKVIIASNGYTPNHLHPKIHGRALPVLSSIIVTQPLTPSQLSATGLSAKYQFMDTRALKYYFRLLPDGRLLFGGRGAIKGKDAQHPRYAGHLRQALLQTFPALAELSVDYFWSGWISVALDDYPRIYEVAPNVYTSMGYCGAGVSFSSLAGQRLAELSMGKTLPALPFYQSGLPKFPLPGLRRLGQWLFYQWAQRTERM